MAAAVNDKPAALVLDNRSDPLFDFAAKPSAQALAWQCGLHLLLPLLACEFLICAEQPMTSSITQHAL